MNFFKHWITRGEIHSGKVRKFPANFSNFFTTFHIFLTFFFIFLPIFHNFLLFYFMFLPNSLSKKITFRCGKSKFPLEMIFYEPMFSRSADRSFVIPLHLCSKLQETFKYKFVEKKLNFITSKV